MNEYGSLEDNTMRSKSTSFMKYQELVDELERDVLVTEQNPEEQIDNEENVNRGL